MRVEHRETQPLRRAGRASESACHAAAAMCAWLVLVASPILPLGPVAQAQSLAAAPSRLENAGVGRVLAALPDGGFIVAGDWTSLAGGPMRDGIARIRADGSVVAAFDPRIESPNGLPPVTVAVADGRVFFGGSFTRVDGQPRAGLAAIDLATNTLTAFDPATPGSQIRWLDARDGVLYVAGFFAGGVIGGASRTGLAALDTQTGAATDWNPGPVSLADRVLAAVDGIFVAGFFRSDTALNPPRNHIAKFDRASGALLPFDARLPAGVDLLVLHRASGALYVGGEFSTAIQGAWRSGAAAFDADSGDLQPFHPNVAGGFGGPIVADIEVVGDAAFLCGSFSRVRGQIRVGAAEVAADTGAARSWNGNLEGEFQCSDMLADGDTLVATGSFDRAGGQSRLGLVRLRRSDASPVGDLPDLLRSSGAPRLSAAPDGRRIAFGEFISAGGERTQRLAVFGSDGTVLLRVPQLNGIVYATATDGSTLFVGGNSLTLTGREPVSALLAFDLTTGAPRPAPAVKLAGSGTPIVQALAINGGDLLIGGNFDRVDGATVTHFAAVRIADSALRAAPLVSGIRPSIRGISVGGGRVVVLGEFFGFAGAQRQSLAALDASSYALLPFSAGASSNVTVVLAAEQRIYLGGQFGTLVDGVTGRPAARNGVGAFDAATGALLPFHPDLRIAGRPTCDVLCYASSLALAGDVLYVGGLFDTAGGQSRKDFAAVDAVTGALRPFDIGLRSPALVSGLSVAGGTLFVAGGFSEASGQRRRGIAAYDLGVTPPPDELFRDGFESAP